MKFLPIFSKALFLLTFLALFANLGHAQKWKYYRHEVSAYTGATNFLGELGGNDELNPKFYHIDLDLKATRPSFGVAYGYKLFEKINLRTNVIFARVSGSDEFTQNIYRNVRNLSFRSDIWEGSMQLEYYWLKEKTGASYKLKGIKSSFMSNLAGYAFIGGGGIYFNPQAQYNGQWVDLAPLNTEGQGLPDADGNIIPDYEQFTAVFIYGAGFKYFLNKQMSISVEYGARHAFSDYLDDVSTVYYDNAALRAAYGDMSADLADRNVSEFPSWTGTNQQRGSPTSNDFYMYGTVGFNYKFLKGRSIKPRF